VAKFYGLGKKEAAVQIALDFGIIFEKNRVGSRRQSVSDSYCRSRGRHWKRQWRRWRDCALRHTKYRKESNNAA